MGKFFPSKDMHGWLPEDFLEDAGWGTAPARRQPTPTEAILAATRVEGYLTHNWFGPFLLGPARPLGRGWC